MPTGFETYDASGKLQVNNEMLTYALQRTGTVTTVNSGFGMEISRMSLTSIGTTDLVVLSNAAGWGASMDMNGVGPASRYFLSNAPIGTVFNYYVYRTSNNLPQANFGIQILNNAGQVTWSTNYRSLLSPAILLGSYHGSQSFTLAGKKLGFCILGYGGYKQYLNYQEEGGFPQQYSYDHKWYSVGAASSNSEQTINTNVIITFDGYVSTQSAPDFSQQHDMSAYVLAVDVTNIPIGVTFF